MSDWWQGCVIYQIYPRSYKDSSGDGCGDLAGITEKLGYIASLGVDAIWISPFFASPMKDFGYDVSDYCAIDPLFGSMADFDALIEKAHELNIKAIVDLVVSHTSDQHPWFIESRESLDNQKSDWYVWADAKPDGTPPNNWLSIFGGTAWQWDTRRCQYYLHNFLTSQPDLNFHNPQVQAAVLNVAEFWLNKGVDGFRLDTINFYFHDKELRNNPALSQDQRTDSIAPRVNPYNFQEHIYDRNRPENIAFLEKFRQLLDKYDDRIALGEVGDAQRGLEIIGEYTKGNKRVHMCYSFEFLGATKLTSELIKNTINDFFTVAADGWPCFAFSNHDVKRHATRFVSDTNAPSIALQEKIQQAAVLLSLPGSSCIYQGEELGLPEAQIQFEDLQDPYGIEFWPEFAGRDGCRTPMVWNNNIDAGFSDVAKTWLPIPQSHLPLAVCVQENDNESLLNYYRKLINLRKNNLALKSGSIEFSKHNNDCLQYLRKHRSQNILCVFNLSNNNIDARLEYRVDNIIFKSSPDIIIKDDRILLPAKATLFIQITS